MTWDERGRTVEYFVGEPCVQADVLEKGYRVAGRRADGGREDPVRGGACKTARDKLKGCFTGASVKGRQRS